MPSQKRPPELQSIVDELSRAGPFGSIGEMNRSVALRTRDYNAAPQAELGGLSPDEMSQLLYGDWTSHGALRLNDALSLNELAGAAILADARTLLNFVADQGPLKETTARNLSRATVAALLPRLRMPAQRRLAVDIGEPPPLNEGDVLWLPALRHTMMFAGLLMRRKGLRMTPRGRELLSPHRSGELFALLFRTVFRTLNLGVFDRDARHRGLQPTVAYSFYKLRTVARDWSTSEALADSAWLESAKDPPTEWESQHADFRHYTFRHRVLEPLVQFGLLEDRMLPTEDRWKDPVEFRATPLFDRMMRFEFRRHAGRDPFLMR
ncbi:MAG: hypothetical protein M3Z10_06975 [Gemmatimonadota bacterium]|nr:hypothetical protein [Gemmatimonadota bacterium]